MKNNFSIVKLSLIVSVFLVEIICLLLPLSVVYAEDVSPDVQFEIKAFAVAGDPHLAEVPTSYILKPFIGPEKSFQIVKKAVATLEKAFRRQGHPGVNIIIPEQKFNDGVVHLIIIESKIGEVQVEGNQFFSTDNILRSIPGLSEGQSFNASAISRSLALANMNPAKKTFLILSNSNQADVIDASLKVEDQKLWKVATSLDNTGDGSTGHYRQGVFLQYANMFQRDQRMSVQYITSPSKPDHVSIYGVGYEIPLYNQYASLDATVVYSDVDSGTVDIGSSALQISGRGFSWGLHYTRLLERIGQYEHKLIFGADSRTYKSDVDLSGVQLGNEITVHPLSVTYSGSFVHEKWLTGFYVSILHNLPGGWATKDSSEDFETVRTGAQQSYNIVRSGAQMNYSLPGNWSAFCSLNGQYSSDKLVPGEQYGLGGAGSIRGFSEREYTNDRGYSGTVELYTPNMGSFVNKKDLQLRGVLFFDGGHLSRIGALSGEAGSITIASAGPGLRITKGKRLSFSMDYGIVVDSAEGGREVGDGTCHFKLNFNF